MPGDSLGKNTGVGWHSLLQGIFPFQGSNPGLLHCRQILYHLSHQGSSYPTGYTPVQNKKLKKKVVYQPRLSPVCEPISGWAGPALLHGALLSRVPSRTGCTRNTAASLQAPCGAQARGSGSHLVLSCEELPDLTGCHEDGKVVKPFEKHEC